MSDGGAPPLPRQRRRRTRTRLSHLLERLLDLARADMAVAPEDAATTVEEAARARSPTPIAGAISRSRSIWPDLPAVAAPAELIEAVLETLIENSRQAGARQVTVTGRVAAVERIRVTVSDDGQGIAEADQERIFEPFHTSRRGQGGSGLGLSIARSLPRRLRRHHVSRPPGDAGAPASKWSCRAQGEAVAVARGYYGASSRSIVATSAGSSGAVSGAKRQRPRRRGRSGNSRSSRECPTRDRGRGRVRQVVPVRADRVRLRFRQQRAEGMLAGARHLQLGEHRKTHRIVRLTECGEFGFGPRFLPAEIVRRESGHGETLVPIAPEQRLKALILRGETPLRYDGADPYLPDLLIRRPELAEQALTLFRALPA